MRLVLILEAVHEVLGRELLGGDRDLTEQDRCTQLKLQTSFAKSGDLRTLVLDVLTAPTALYVRTSL